MCIWKLHQWLNLNGNEALFSQPNASVKLLQWPVTSCWQPFWMNVGHFDWLLGHLQRVVVCWWLCWAAWARHLCKWNLSVGRPLLQRDKKAVVPKFGCYQLQFRDILFPVNGDLQLANAGLILGLDLPGMLPVCSLLLSATPQCLYNRLFIIKLLNKNQTSE